MNELLKRFKQLQRYFKRGFLVDSASTRSNKQPDNRVVLKVNKP